MRSLSNPAAIFARQRGVSVISGVFLLLLMALLAALMVNLSSTANRNLAADIDGSRTYQIARAGAEWAMYQLDPNAESNVLPKCASVPATPPSISGYTLTVGCSASPDDSTAYSESGKSIRIFRISSRAVANGATSPGVERVVEVTLEKCRDSLKTAAPYDC